MRNHRDSSSCLEIEVVVVTPGLLCSLSMPITPRQSVSLWNDFFRNVLPLLGHGGYPKTLLFLMFRSGFLPLNMQLSMESFYASLLIPDFCLRALTNSSNLTAIYPCFITACTDIFFIFPYDHPVLEFIFLD